MNYLQNKSRQDQNVLICHPECPIYTPDLIRQWGNDLDLYPDYYEKLADGFFGLIPGYCEDGEGNFPGLPEFWQRNLLSYSFYFGLGLTIFNRELAQKLIYGLTEGPSRFVLFFLNEIKGYGSLNKVEQWNFAVNVLTYFTQKASPETTGPDTDATLLRSRGPIAGFTPAIRLGLNDREFAETLFEGAVDEKEKCDDEELIGRVDWIKWFVINSYVKQFTSSNN